MRIEEGEEKKIHIYQSKFSSYTNDLNARMTSSLYGTGATGLKKFLFLKSMG